MVGILVQLLLSWVIIRWSGLGDLSVLGLRPEAKRMVELLFLLVFAAACSSLGFLLRMHYGHEVWDLNPSLTASLVWGGVWYNIKSVLFEELIFRGVLLVLLMKRFGNGGALLLSSLAFGVYHWFTFEVLGQPLTMLVVLCITGLAGVLYGYAFIRTRSMYAAIGLHFGWNFVQSVLFSAGNIGKGILVERLPLSEVQVSMFTYMVVMYLPLIMFYVGGLTLVRARR
jgi:uncharacterized protein